MRLKYLDPSEFACSMLGNPSEGTRWHRWIHGEEPQIHRQLAHDMWATLSQAENLFIHSSHPWTTPDKYNWEKVGWNTVVAQFDQDLDLFLDEIDLVLERVNCGLLSPHGFEHVVVCQQEISHCKSLDKNIIRTMSAYSIYCLDLALRDLFEENQSGAVLRYAYSVTALEMCRMYIKLQDPSGVAQKAARSSIGRTRAELRHKETRELEAEVIGYWKAVINPTSPNLSNEKSAALLKKVFPLATRTLSSYVAKAKRDMTKQSPN